MISSHPEKTIKNIVLFASLSFARLYRQSDYKYNGKFIPRGTLFVWSIAKSSAKSPISKNRRYYENGSLDYNSVCAFTNKVDLFAYEQIYVPVFMSG